MKTQTQLGRALAKALNEITNACTSMGVELRVAEGYLTIGADYTYGSNGRTITTDAMCQPWYFKIVGMLYNPATNRTIWDHINLNDISNADIKSGVEAVTTALSRTK